MGRLARTFLLVLLLCCLSLGSAYAGWRISGDSASSVAELPARKPVLVSADVADLSRTFQFQAVLADQEGEEIRSLTSGFVTWVTEADQIVEGDPLFAVNQSEVVTIFSASPIWRQLEFKSTGQDVAAVQKFLFDAGLLEADEIDGTMDGTTVRAARDWRRWLQFDSSRPPGPDTFLSVRPALAGRDFQPLVAPGDEVQVGTPIGVAISRERRVSMPVPTSDLQSLERVDVFEWAIDGLDATGTARVESISDQISVTDGGTLVREVRLQLLGSDVVASLPDGARLSVSATLVDTPDALTLPVGAISTSATGEPAVILRRSAESAEQGRVVVVTLGTERNGKVEILSGLSAGDLVELPLASR